LSPATPGIASHIIAIPGGSQLIQSSTLASLTNDASFHHWWTIASPLGSPAPYKRKAVRFSVRYKILTGNPIAAFYDMGFELNVAFDGDTSNNTSFTFTHLASAYTTFGTPLSITGEFDVTLTWPGTAPLYVDYSLPVIGGGVDTTASYFYLFVKEDQQAW
jgi:hypothetical protein